ncbi:MAG: hemerythrin domain-containing protein [Cyclobacteriaceae bacterium]
MNNPRYNSFLLIHKGLRTLLYETSTQLQQGDLSDPQCDVIDQIEKVLFLFEGHAHGEDKFYNGPLMDKDARISSMFMKEHEEDHRLGEVLTDLVDQWRNASDNNARAFTGRNLLYAFYEFIAFNLYHMNKEELELNQVLWSYYTDEEIKATEHTMVQQIAPEKMIQYAKWIIRGNNDEDLYQWLKGVQMFAPVEVFKSLFAIAQTELNTERVQALGSRLGVDSVSELV